VAAFVLFNLAVQLRFLIYDDLIIEISPVQLIEQTASNRVPLEFDVKISNFRFCEPDCRLDFVDPYRQETLASEKLHLENRSSVTWETNVDLGMSGAGEREYYLYVTCTNKESFLCRTNGNPSFRSVMVTVNRSFTPEEMETLRGTRERLSSTYEMLMKKNSQQEKLNRTIAGIRAAMNSELREIQLMKPLFDEFNRAVKSYYDQDFTDIELDFSGFDQAFARLNDSLGSYNTNVKILRNLSNNTYLNAYEFYVKTNNSRAELMEKECRELENLSCGSFEEIAGLDSLQSRFEKINAIIFGYGESKLAAETTLLREIGNLSRLIPLNTSGDLCRDLQLANEAIQEHNAAAVNGTQNFTHILDFIADSLFWVHENETHLLGRNSSILNDGGLNLSGYLGYVNFPHLPAEYCIPVEPLLNGSLTNYSAVALELEEVVPEPLVLGEPESQCCIYGECSACSIDPGRYPIIFVHGHSLNKENSPESSVKAFFHIQKKMSEDGLIVNAGDIDYASPGTGYWSMMEPPVGILTTYYYFSYYDAESISKEIRKEEGIESYSIRLKELVDTVLSRTGAEKVVIVAHSMGGLVTRSYLQLFGEEKVDKVILIATPNHGVSPTVEQFCNYFGDKRACRDMGEGSAFMKKLADYTPGIPVFTIIGTGCDSEGKDGDGIVQAESSELDYADNIHIAGECDSEIVPNFHKDLLDPEKYPQVYGELKRIIFG
jgi:hypothetical protein